LIAAAFLTDIAHIPFFYIYFYPPITKWSVSLYDEDGQLGSFYLCVY
jgi:hypothetical protein